MRPYRARELARLCPVARVMVLLLVTGLAPAAPAQSPTATLAGVVRDETGAVVPDVEVVVRNVESGVARSLTTDEDGAFSAGFRFRGVRCGRNDAER